ncbi:Dyp-type peroxidase domain-containing protein, partial [Streptomyces spiralis]|uniref:Dyp-type peroxidase domain-containing protein n=1 Tax=Streptomyces spiralis TaxID=66376 RepID=UPI0034049219
MSTDDVGTDERTRPGGQDEPAAGPGGRTADPGGVARRRFLRGAALAGAGLATVGGVAAATGSAALPAPAAGGLGPGPGLAAPAVAAFHGPRQQSVLAAPRRSAAFVAFDVTAEDRAELTDVLRTLTDRARFLTCGGIPEPVGITG